MKHRHVDPSNPWDAPKIVWDAIEKIPQDLADAALAYAKQMGEREYLNLTIRYADGIEIGYDDGSITIGGTVSPKGEFIPVTAQPDPIL